MEYLRLGFLVFVATLLISQGDGRYDDRYYILNEVGGDLDSLNELYSGHNGYDPSSSATHEAVDHLEPREPEEENKAVPTGTQLISGGAGEGTQALKPAGDVQNKQEIKTSNNLPSYCSPPNPCPKGQTAADGCQENIPDTAVFNRRYIMMQIANGLCDCDTEHMSSDSCPYTKSESSDDDYKVGDNYSDLHTYLEKILDQDEQNDRGSKNPYALVGEKRESMTAKKGSHHRAIRSLHNGKNVGRKANPFLGGVKLRVVAKKSPRF